MRQYYDDEPKSLFDYWLILKRRRYLFAIPAAAIVLITGLMAVGQTPVYRSQATILIEDQEIPEDIVGPTMTNYASQQIQVISQRVLTADNIKAVVEKFDVYPGLGDDESVPALMLANRFREDMELDLVSTDVIGAQGRSTKAAIAFTLAFNNPDPRIAQQVAEELVSLFLNENRRSSEVRTAGVSELLRAAMEDANEDLIRTEADLAEFKSTHEGALPELQQLNLSVIDRTEQQLSDVNLRIQELEQRKLQLSTQLAPISPTAPVTLPSGETIMGDRERLRALEVDFRRKSAIYEAGHPDLVRLEREIQTLRATVGDAGSYESLQNQLREERDRLGQLRERYADNHPDIKAAESAIASLQSQLESFDERGLPENTVADNPAYVLIQTQLQSAELETKSLLQKRSELQATIAKHEALIKQAPNVEMQYEALLRNYENARTKYTDLQERLRAAEVSANVGQEISGQRFTLIEPPALPLYPEGQNRQAIFMMGFLLAGGVGIGFVVIAEFMDTSIRNPKELTTVVGSFHI
jgi:succinoglycan biosynthesis transport protein ExoP